MNRDAYVILYSPKSHPLPFWPDIASKKLTYKNSPKEATAGIQIIGIFFEEQSRLALVERKETGEKYLQHSRVLISEVLSITHRLYGPFFCYIYCPTVLNVWCFKYMPLTFYYLSWNKSTFLIRKTTYMNIRANGEVCVLKMEIRFKILCKFRDS